MISAIWQVQILQMLLGDGAKRAYEVMDNFKPLFPSKEAYFESINRFDLDSERIEYNEKGDAVVHLD